MWKFIIIAVLLIALTFCAAYLWAVYTFFRRRVYFPAVLMLALPIVTHEAFQYYWYSKAIPEKIGITYPISMHAETGITGGCGAFVFKLSPGTLKIIEKNGLGFFIGATDGRGHPGDPYYHYAEWKQTPLPPSWTSEGSWMLCSGLSNSEHSKIVAAAKSKGAYYTTKHEGQLVLIPSLGYIVYSFFG